MTNLDDVYDVIIVGGSFAGLSTAYFTDADRILILERQERLGLRQRSTCCTSVEWLKKLGCEKSILKTFDTMTFHSSSGSTAVAELPVSFATIDYRPFCETLGSNLKNADIITGTNVVGIKDAPEKRVLSNKGEFRGGVVVDCSGWRAVVASHLTSQRYVDKSKLAYGIEVETEYEGDTNTIHIYYGKKFIKQGYAWIFPTGEEKARIGLGGYCKFDTRRYLQSFVDFLGVKSDNINPHGGAIPCHGLRESVVDGIFVVGDSDGQVLPLVGEGIRKSLYYGEICGKLITRVVKGEMELSEALDAYREEVNKSLKFYNTLYFAQNMAVHAPDWARNKAIKKLSEMESKTIKRVTENYLNDAIISSRFRITMKLLGAILF